MPRRGTSLRQGKKKDRKTAKDYRGDPLYDLESDEEGFYHCPFSDCNNPPTKFRGSYRGHLDIHIRPYECPYTGCNTDYVNIRYLFAHEYRHHLCPVDECDRGLPEKGFAEKEGWYEHMKENHGWKRIRKSCVNCRNHNYLCNGASPCNQCTQSALESCAYKAKPTSNEKSMTLRPADHKVQPSSKNAKRKRATEELGNALEHNTEMSSYDDSDAEQEAPNTGTTRSSINRWRNTSGNKPRLVAQEDPGAIALKEQCHTTGNELKERSNSHATDDSTSMASSLLGATDTKHNSHGVLFRFLPPDAVMVFLDRLPQQSLLNDNKAPTFDPGDRLKIQRGCIEAGRLVQVINHLRTDYRGSEREGRYWQELYDYLLLAVQVEHLDLMLQDELEQRFVPPEPFMVRLKPGVALAVQQVDRVQKLYSELCAKSNGQWIEACQLEVVFHSLDVTSNLPTHWRNINACLQYATKIDNWMRGRRSGCQYQDKALEAPVDYDMGGQTHTDRRFGQYERPFKDLWGSPYWNETRGTQNIHSISSGINEIPAVRLIPSDSGIRQILPSQAHTIPSTNFVSNASANDTLDENRPSGLFTDLLPAFKQY